MSGGFEAPNTRPELGGGVHKMPHLLRQTLSIFCSRFGQTKSSTAAFVANPAADHPLHVAANNKLASQTVSQSASANWPKNTPGTTPSKKTDQDRYRVPLQSPSHFALTTLPYSKIHAPVAE